jgi:hypothetical protein
VRPGLVLDATARPDFAQVEADDEIVNLTRFEVFLPEKRDFFLENAGAPRSTWPIPSTSTESTCGSGPAPRREWAS